MKVKEFLNPFIGYGDELLINIVTGPNSVVCFLAKSVLDVPEDMKNIKVTSAKIENIPNENEILLIINEEVGYLTYSYEVYDKDGKSLCEFSVSSLGKPNFVWLAAQITNTINIEELGLIEMTIESSDGEYFDSDVSDDDVIREIVKIGERLSCPEK